MADALEVFKCITPAVARFMPWEPPHSFDEYKARREKMLQSKDQNALTFVIRRLDNMECLGLASLDDPDAVSPELGIWLKESAHGHGYGREAVTAVAEWASRRSERRVFFIRWQNEIKQADG